MDLELGTKYEDLRREVNAFLDEHRDEAVLERQEGADPARTVAWQKTLVEHGYVGRTIPKEYGGYGAEYDPLESLVIDETFGERGVSLGLRNQGIDMFVPTVLQYGTEEQKRAYIGPTIRGEMIWCQGYSEPGSGSDLASLRTSGRLEGDHYVLNGQKIWTSSAHVADMMFALVRTEPDAGKHAGITYLVLPMSTPGIEVRPLMTMTGEASFNEVFFTDARVPRENVIGEPGQGWEIGTYLLRFERGMLGSPRHSERLFRGCRELLEESGKIEDPVYRDRLMRLEARLLAMKYHGLRLLTDVLKQRASGVSSLIVKLQGCQLNYDICALALDAMGESGLLRAGSRRVRDEGFWQATHQYSLGLIIGGGTAQIQKNIIGEIGLGLPREPKPAKSRPATAAVASGGGS